MNLYSILFISILILGVLFLIFRPTKGWWYQWKAQAPPREKVILEDILKLLFNSSKDGNSKSVRALVKELPFNESQVLKVLRGMEDNDLVQLLHSDIRLTDKGTDYALRIIRAHRLWERYLSEKTGYDKREWHKLAEKAEHSLTEEDLERLSKELKKPLFDPHGSPIPYDSKSIPALEGSPLISFSAGDYVRIVHIQDEPETIYQQILAEKIHIGSQVEIKELNDKYVLFHSEGKNHKLELMVANALTVKPIEEAEIITEQMYRLSSLKAGETGVILGISKESRGENRRRLLDMGFVRGTEVTATNISPMGDPIAYTVRETLIALRNEQAQYILINKLNENDAK